MIQNCNLFQSGSDLIPQTYSQKELPLVEKIYIFRNWRLIKTGNWHDFYKNSCAKTSFSKHCSIGLTYFYWSSPSFVAKLEFQLQVGCWNRSIGVLFLFKLGKKFPRVFKIFTIFSVSPRVFLPIPLYFQQTLKC